MTDMTATTKNGKYFWLLNLLVIVIAAGISVKSYFIENTPSEYRFPLNETAHYVKAGFAFEDDVFSGALKVPAGDNAGADLLGNSGHIFMVPGEQPYREFTIAAAFDYTPQYDALQAGGVIPGIRLPGLGDSYEIYLNGNLVASEWHADGGKVTVHKLARGTVYPINPGFFVRGENKLVFRVYGDPSTVDTGLTVTNKYVIDDIKSMVRFDYFQTVFAGICLSAAFTFMVFFLMNRKKKLPLWFSATAFSISLYALFRAGAFQSVFKDYDLSLRLEVLSLFTVAYFSTVLVYMSGKEKFNTVIKIYSGIYLFCTAAAFLPGRQFVLDLVKVFFILFVPFIIYAFVSSLCVPLVRDVRSSARHGGESVFRRTLYALSGTLRGNMLTGAFLPVVFALFNLLAYVFLSSHEIVLSQYGFLLFFANVTFALASDNAETHGKLITISDELRMMVSERESELVRKSGEVEEAKTARTKFNKMVAKEIRAPIGEIIGSIELQMLRADLTEDMAGWLNRLLEAERDIRRKLDAFHANGDDYTETVGYRYDFESADTYCDKSSSSQNPGGTRHLFVINPKSFVTLKDMKNFLLSIEMCFSVGHRAEYKVYISRYPRDACSAVYRYLSASPPDETVRVYSVGGDGILFDCLNGLAQFPNAELAPIPYGNANDFVSSFGAENMDMFRDIKLMSKSPSRLADAILCGRHYALGGCSIGVEAKAVQTFADTIERINFGKVRYFVQLMFKLGAVKALLDGSQSKMHYDVTFDGEDFSGNYLVISIANIALNGGGNIPNPLAVPDDGSLDVITCKSSSAMRALKMLPAYTSGQFGKYPDYFRHRRVKEVHCKSDKQMSVILDGETFRTHELDIKILPKAVRIVSPNGIGFADYSQRTKGGAK